MMIFFWMVWALFMGLCVALSIRNRFVYLERKQILKEIHTLSVADIDAGRFLAWMPHYDAFDDGPSYYRMVLEVWRPVRSYRSELLR